jgi:hypothetical protein
VGHGLVNRAWQFVPYEASAFCHNGRISIANHTRLAVPLPWM